MVNTNRSPKGTTFEELSYSGSLIKYYVEVKNMKVELNEKVLEFVRFLTLNEKSQNTIDKYIIDINDFIKWYSENVGEIFLIEKLNKEVLIDFKLYLKNKYTKVTTINSKISVLNTFLTYYNMQYLKIKTVKYQKTLFSNRDRQMTKTELHKLLNEAYKKKNKQIYYIISTMARTGIRVSELKYITFEAVKDGKAIVDNKGKVRPVIIPKNLCELLISYCRQKNIKKGSIFVTRNGNAVDRKNIWQEMKNLCKSVEVDDKKVFPHNLRHIFAIEFYQETKDIVKLASVLGHSSIETTRIYTLEGEDKII